MTVRVLLVIEFFWVHVSLHLGEGVAVPAPGRV